MDRDGFGIGNALWAAVQRKREQIGTALLRGEISTAQAKDRLEHLRQQYYGCRSLADGSAQEREAVNE